LCGWSEGAILLLTRAKQAAEDIRSHLGGPPVDSEECFLGCRLYSEIPAVTGHWTISSFFGVDEFPGYSYQATVVKVK
jgi:hypothetical protein